MKLILKLPDGTSASIDQADQKWASADPRLAVFCTICTAGEAASYLPHPFLDAARKLAEKLGAELEIVGAVNGGKPETIH